MGNNALNRRVRVVAGRVLMFLAAGPVLLSETMKFLHIPAVVQEMSAAGFGGAKLLLVATLGSVSALLFLYGRTRSIGLLLLSSFLGGAICTHIQQGKYQTVAAPVLLLVFAWWGTYLRHPEMLWSFAKPATVGQHSEQPGWASGEAL